MNATFSEMGVIWDYVQSILKVVTWRLHTNLSEMAVAHGLPQTHLKCELHGGLNTAFSEYLRTNVNKAKW